MRLRSVLDKLEAQEREWAAREVLAPVLPSGPVRVRIGGVVCSLQIDDESFSGWAVLLPISTQQARLVREASRAEVGKYLGMLPRVRLLALTRDQADKARACVGASTGVHARTQAWWALSAHEGDSRFVLDGPVSVRGCEAEVQPFDALAARFDGRTFWFEGPDSRRPPAIAAYLRESWHANVQPRELSKKGLSREERAAYELAWRVSQEAREEQRKNSVEGRLESALEHAQGRLMSFVERGDSYTVTYRVHERTHTSIVRKGDLAVVTSGICLSGRDGDFDLTSLVGVMREAGRIGHEMDY